MRRARQTGKRHGLIGQFDEWAAAHWHRLYACAEKNADEWTDVDLLLADTLRTVARVFSSRPMGAELMVRYTMRCLRNAARQHRRHNIVARRAETRFGEAEQRRQQEGESVHGQHSLRAALLDALQEMPQERADLLRMKQWERLSFADIAQRTGMPESTVRRRYEAALETLRTQLQTKRHG